MLKPKPLIILTGALLLLWGCASNSPRTREKITRDWTFALGEYPEAAAPDFDDSSWRHLNLPHDWAIEGDFAEDNPSGTGGGALPGGIGWYRKTIEVSADDLSGHVFVDFDGVYMNSEVFVNGQSLGVRPYGYISFRHDLTPHLHEGSNVIAVRVDNAEQPNSRWYSGCGIYRNVWLVKTGSVYVDNWGTCVTTPSVSGDFAEVSVQTTVRGDEPCDVSLRSTVLDAKGHKVASVEGSFSVDSLSVIPQVLGIPDPTLWSLERPYLYTLRTEIYSGGRLADSYETPFGVRSFSFSASEGFILNGERVKINGVCLHHDLGCLGAAVNRRAIERQLEILQDMGCNGIRCSHNPPAPELLDLCDSMGFIVMDETFDMWRKKKTDHDYARYFDEWHERDLTDLVLRDRNHPSVFMWSIGNEVLEQWTDASADTLDLQAANLILNMKRDASSLAGDSELSVNSLLCQKLCDMVHELDPTRPVTSGNNEPDPGNHLFKAGTLDIIGFNYHDSYFSGVPENFPGKPFIVTESVSALMTRGYYRMPSNEEFVWPSRWDIPFYDPSFSCSSYDNCHVPWGNTHEGTWKLVKENDFISGQYIWTGFDYIGEPTPYGWPARSSYFGLIDLAGFPKDIYYMYQSEWTDKTVLHLFPHWNWEEGQTVDMWCYYSGADEVELFVNGVSKGVRTKEGFHASWRVVYEPGEVCVVSRLGGETVAGQTIRTAGEPAAIRLTPDRSTIKADGEDLSFVTVEVVDAEGNLCPWAENDIRFSATGGAFIAGVDNGSPISLERFKTDHRKAFYGKCLVVLQSAAGVPPPHYVSSAIPASAGKSTADIDPTSSSATLTATSPGLASAQVTVRCR